MKKQTALALAAVFSLSVAGTALAAPANPFVDVPANHWAYDALLQLQKSGAVGGYGDGTFRGDRTLTRYEMAAIVAKITAPAEGKDGALIKKLQSEFVNELYNLGVRVDKLEKNASSIKFDGDARIRYQQGMAIGAGAAKFSNETNSSRFEERIRLNLEADVNDKVTFYGRILAENTSNAYQIDPAVSSKVSSTGQTYFDRAEFKWTNGNSAISAGRLLPALGQGLIWDESSADGFLLSHDFGRVALSAGYLDLAANNMFGSSNNAAVANLGLKVTDNINLSVAYLKAINPQDSVGKLSDTALGYDFKQLAYGANAKFGDFLLKGEYVKNHNAPANSDDNGVWGRLQWKDIDTSKPGDFAIYVDYMKLGGWAVDSEGYGHTLNVAGGNGIGGAGAKGYGIGIQYVLARNVDMELNGYDLKTYDGSQKYKKSYNFATNFRF